MYNIVVDCGHGGKDIGAIGLDIREKDYNLIIGKKIKDILKDYNCNVLLTRSTDKYLSLEERCQFSNNNNGEIFVSIHCNAHTNQSANGFESYSYNGNKLQDVLHETIIKRVNIKDRGKKKNNFYVLKNTKCSACLLELGFITNKQDSEILNENIYEFSYAISKAIIDYLSLKQIDNRDLYRVCVGSYINKENANNMLKQLEKDGYKPFILKATI